MSIVSNIRELCNGKNTNFAALERELDFGQGTIRKWDNSSPSVDKIEKVANYFDVTVDYLIGNEQKEMLALNKKDERDIEKKLNETLDLLGNCSDGLMFDGEPLDDETRELLRASLKSQLEMTKRLAKQKYTPKKYK